MKTALTPTLGSARAALLAAVAFSAVVQTVDGSTIVSTGGPDYGSLTNNRQTFGGVSWTQAGAFRDVVISARLYSEFPTLHTAYLTTQIGPGTTLVDEAAFATFSLPDSATSNVDIFSGLTLEPGTYYLTIRGGGGGPDDEFDYWMVASQATATSVTAPGVTFNGYNWLQDVTETYVPASSFSPSDDQRIFTVTGTLVPEPAAAILLMIGSVSIFARRTRRSPEPCAAANILRHSPNIAQAARSSQVMKAKPSKP